MDRSIGSLYKECIRLLDTLADASSLQLQRASLKNADVYDELDRFKIWGGNIGAGHLASTKISLDWRLRDATELREEILQLLEEILDALRNLHEIVSGHRDNQSAEIEVEGDEQDETTLVSEATELFGIVSDSISGLFRLTLIIQKATPRDRFIRASINVQEPFDPVYDVLHVGAKFPKLDNEKHVWLQRKLANAVTQRRQFFRYSRDHQERKSKVKPEQPVVLPSGKIHSNQLQADMLSQAKPKSLAQTQASTLQLDHLDTARYEVDRFDDGMSQTSFSTSINEGDDNNRLRVPNLKEISKKLREFECPYCHTIVAPRNQRQWKKHVFEDLRPYLCTSEDCDTKLFSDRRTWFDHELSEHRHSYKCLFCHSHIFQSKYELQNHITKHHSEMPASNTPEKLLEAARTAPYRFAAAECPFCDEWSHHLRGLNPHISSEDVIFVTPKQFRNHLAVHMEQLALFALPKPVDDDDNDGNSNSAGVFVGSGHSSADNAYGKDQAQSSEQTVALTHEDYTVALISSISTVEGLALRMLDQQHDNLPVSSSDPNHYSLGQIGYHNVVLVTPRSGADENAVLSMATLLQTFSKLRFGFSIETGSGVPSDPNEDPQLDLHLGDVVINHQSSMDVELPDESKGTETRSGLKGALPLPVRYALRSIPTQIENEGMRIRLFLDSILANGLREDENYNYPGDIWDRLFDWSSAKDKNSRRSQDSQNVLTKGKHNIHYLNPGQKMSPPCDNCSAAQMACVMSKGRCRQCERKGATCTWQNPNPEDLIARRTRDDPSIPVVHEGKIVKAIVRKPGAESTPIHSLRIHEVPIITPLAPRTSRDSSRERHDRGREEAGHEVRRRREELDALIEVLRDEERARSAARDEALRTSVHIRRIREIDDEIAALEAQLRAEQAHRQDSSVLCIEKDFTYLPTTLPCLSVRGIVNYSHDRLDFQGVIWQGYATGVATAYAMHILDSIQESLDHRNSEWLAQKQKITGFHQSGYSILDIRDNMRDHYKFDATPFQYQRQITIWRLVRPDNVENRHVNQQGQSAAPGHGIGEAQASNEDFVIKCICLRSEDDGYTILCENCNTWQHIACYYKPENVPGDDDIHSCVDCDPRDVDAGRAVAVQMTKVAEDPGELSYETRRALEELERMKKNKDPGELSYETRRALEELEALKKEQLREEEAQREAEAEREIDAKIERDAEAEAEWQAKRWTDETNPEAEWEVKRFYEEEAEKAAEREKIGKQYMEEQLLKDGYTKEEIDSMLTRAEERRREGQKGSEIDATAASTSIVGAEQPPPI